MTHNDRRRVLFAAVLTSLALPALWIFNGGTASTGSGAKPASAAQAATGDSGPPVTEYVPEPPIFLEGEGDGKVVRPAIINIAIPPPPSASEITGRASYVRYADPSSRPCTTLLAPAGALLTVVNVNNLHSTTCRNTLGIRLAPGIDIVIHTDVFAEIANLTDAPIPVRISW